MENINSIKVLLEGAETLSSEQIDKLATITTSNDNRDYFMEGKGFTKDKAYVDCVPKLSGTIRTSSEDGYYLDSVNDLLNANNELTIDRSRGEQFVRFKDYKVFGYVKDDLLKRNSKLGITLSDIQSRKGELPPYFFSLNTSTGTKNRKDIEYFNEFEYFTGITDLKYSAFGASKIKEITLPNSIVQTSGALFFNCFDLKKIKINSGVLFSKEGHADFSGCSALKEVRCDTLDNWLNCTFPAISSNPASLSKCLYIGNSEEPLTEIFVPNNFTQINSYAFYDNKSLESVDFNNVNTIKNDAFNGTNLKEINSNKILRLEGLAFLNCPLLERVYLPNLLALGQASFMLCTNLNDITLGNSLTSIPANCFKLCSGIINIDLPNSITSIEQASFLLCTNLKEIELPVNIISIKRNAFLQCTKLLKLTIPNSLKIIEEGGLLNCVNLQLHPLDLTNITTLGNSALAANKQITGFIFDKIETIGEKVFGIAQNLNFIAINTSTVPSLANSNAFESNYPIYVLADIYDLYLEDALWNLLSSRLKKIGEEEWINLFKYSGKYGYYRFYERKRSYLDENLNIIFEDPNTISIIGLTGENISVSDFISHMKKNKQESNSFSGSLITYFDEFALTDFTAIKGFNLNGMFKGSSIKSIVFPDTLTDVCNFAFRQCANLEYVGFNNGIKKIGNCSFLACYNLKLDVTDKFRELTSLGNCCFGPDNNSKRTNGITGVVNMPNLTFDANDKDSDNNAINYTGGQQFRNTNIIGVENLGNVTCIPEFMFSGCNQLEYIKLRLNFVVALDNTNALSDTNNCPILVPADLVDAYKLAPNWSNFASRILSL